METERPQWTGLSENPKSDGDALNWVLMTRHRTAVMKTHGKVRFKVEKSHGT